MCQWFSRMATPPEHLWGEGFNAPWLGRSWRSWVISGGPMPGDWCEGKCFAGKSHMEDGQTDVFPSRCSFEPFHWQESYILKPLDQPVTISQYVSCGSVQFGWLKCLGQYEGDRNTGQAWNFRPCNEAKGFVAPHIDEISSMMHEKKRRKRHWVQGPTSQVCIRIYIRHDSNRSRPSADCLGICQVSQDEWHLFESYFITFFGAPTSNNPRAGYFAFVARDDPSVSCSL